jgi:ribosomal protein L3 glutamine methyltransferase
MNAGALLAIEVGHNRAIVEEALPDLPLTWVDTEGGEEKIFILRREDLV